MRTLSSSEIFPLKRILMISFPICLILVYSKVLDILYHFTHRRRLMYLYASSFFVNAMTGTSGLSAESLAGVYPDSVGQMIALIGISFDVL